MPEKTNPSTFMNTQYKTNEPIKNIGIYFKPLFMLPFSTIDTIREEIRENVLKEAIYL